MKKISLVFLICLINNLTHAQQLYFSGIITFERKENLHKQMTGNGSWRDELLNKMPKYRTDEFKLTFNKDQSAYTITKEESNAFANWWRVAANNMVYNQFANRRTSQVKEVYDEVYLIEDSMPNYIWTYDGEYRNIAGFNCRKASTIINDSLYIIAFYTDEIPVSGGPESLNGLPGMILGFVVPRLNITCFAKEVNTQLLPENAFERKKHKGKSTNFSGFIKRILEGTSDWGEYASKVYFKCLL